MAEPYKEPNAFRSTPMSFVQILMQREAAHDSVLELGDLQCVEFVDCDANKEKTAFQRPWVSEVRECQEILRQLRHFRELADSLDLRGDISEEVPRSSLHDVQVEFAELERELRELTQRQRVMDRTAYAKAEHTFVLEVAGELQPRGVSVSAEVAPMAATAAEEAEEGGRAVNSDRALRSIWGTVPADRREGFERVLFRAARGNTIQRFSTMPRRVREVNSAGQIEEVERVAFVILFSGSVLQDRVGRICTSVDAHRFDVPDSQSERGSLLGQLREDGREHAQVTESAQRRQAQLLGPVSTRLGAYEQWALREKAVHATMNLLNTGISNRTVLAEAWIPTDQTPRVQAALQRACARAGAETPSVLHELKPYSTPPTLIRTNKLTETFQGLNDAYGKPRYLELNPGMFYPVTYSFLFGIMFGDIGHGSIMLMGALGLIAVEKEWEGKKLNELISPAFSGRYVLLLMSLFSIYCGLVYNECFGIALLPWSYYALDCPPEGGNCAATPIAPPAFGVDPVWSIADNKLGFANSFKMKLSILLGVSQMVFGLACKTANCIYFKKWKDLLFENIPEYIFLLSIFGYLCVIVVYKWCTNWVGLGLPAPALLDTLLGMLLEFGSPIPKEQVLYTGQATVQTFLVIIAVLAVPVMLLAKPLLLRAEHKDGYQALELEDKSGEESGGDSHGGHAGTEFDFSECMIHQSIHTIEFVLGAVSNTASYLRLWALSLAHAGLSEVFWERIMLAVLEMEVSLPVQVFAVFCGFAVWASMTFGVLMVMETLSACLHDIRLHWVEFQNKFYGGDGIPFAPLNFALMLESYKEAEEELSSAKHRD